jgi:hypothetical protein
MSHFENAFFPHFLGESRVLLNSCHFVAAVPLPIPKTYFQHTALISAQEFAAQLARVTLVNYCKAGLPDFSWCNLPKRENYAI